jgi:hypothetical protein
MELIFKQPRDKPPCICILFESDYVGGRYNKIIVDHYRKHPFIIKFEFEGGKLSMILQLKDSESKWKYDSLKYDAEKFYKFLYNTKDAKGFSLCHIASKNDTHIVLKTPVNILPWVLKVASVELVQEY